MRLTRIRHWHRVGRHTAANPHSPLLPPPPPSSPPPPPLPPGCVQPGEEASFARVGTEDHVAHMDLADLMRAAVGEPEHASEEPGLAVHRFKGLLGWTLARDLRGEELLRYTGTMQGTWRAPLIRFRVPSSRGPSLCPLAHAFRQRRKRG